MSDDESTLDFATAAGRAAIVAALPRRTAHALYALLEATKELNAPPTAAEIVIYDEEAYSGRATGSALRQARRLGLAVYVDGYWCPLEGAYELHEALEDRYLEETEQAGDD